jgi:hypothetical protein
MKTQKIEIVSFLLHARQTEWEGVATNNTVMFSKQGFDN